MAKWAVAVSAIEVDKLELAISHKFHRDYPEADGRLLKQFDALLACAIRLVESGILGESLYFNVNMGGYNHISESQNGTVYLTASRSL